MRTIDIKKLITENRCKNTFNIDSVSTIEMLKMINEEDKKVALAVEKEIVKIAEAVDLIVEKIHIDGRLIYIGAGTSGRIGILDASECPPTYGTDPEVVQALIAGGEKAILTAIEGAEDNFQLGKEDLKSIDFNEKDVLIGITASGRTPYVLGAVEYANKIGAITIGINNNPDSELSSVCKVSICPVTGPEALTGSTRMKAGTAQKLVLNMISTGVMIKYGKVYQNLMVDVKASNDKLRDRCKSIVIEATGVSIEEAEKILITTNYNCKLAIFIIISKLDMIDAKKILDENKGYIRKAFEAVQK
ncbi:N-acetylmuramic acid 6-phosphate etherase [Sedimentibacter acidaminivorans]|uniref:N-acetylmuramic acid 6-phosphate etherase n=1 Tax=Sedimentibacter acidaminivorans TaxID=913099 RepID=A0ABS4GG54_9FIRM|nr:N-acetylmuramic acid 6-phosphate etherase [Sedimentibacter acidaminivorans]